MGIGLYNSAYWELLGNTPVARVFSAIHKGVANSIYNDRLGAHFVEKND